jgi:queuine tRNA-ribosyltransferase
VARLGGLHRFMNWDRPILTDSGGYQVMSLSELRKLTEEGVEFRSHLDGSKHMLTPERSMEIQRLLGSDIVMAFDECPRADRPRDEIAASMELSMRWAKRSRDGFDAAASMQKARALFGIQQGALDEDCGAISPRRCRHRLRRLCHRRPRRGRGAGGDVRHARLRARQLPQTARAT